MKIKLSKPLYKIDKDLLSKDLPFVRQQKFNRFIRRRIPFFMDGYRYAAKAVKKRWNIDLCFFEAGHTQVMPVYLSGLLNERAGEVWWKMMNEDRNFARNLVDEVKNIVLIEKKLAASVPNRELAPQEIKNYLEDHLAWWIQFFELGYLWFGVENIKEKVDKKIKQGWKKKNGSLTHFLDAVYRPMQFPLSSIEQRDLLKIVFFKGKELETALRNHVNKYKHLSLHNIDDEYFDVEYYRGRIKTLQNPEDYKKQKGMLDSADHELLEANKILEKVKLPENLKEQVEFVRWFMYLRTETIDHMMLVNGAYKPVFASLAKMFNLSIDAVLHMTYEEILSSLEKKKLSISKDLILNRARNGYAYLIAPHGSYLVTGNEVDELHKLVIPKEETKDIYELKGQIAFKGKVTGVARVLLDRRNANELKEGEILVTTMTSPEFAPAMKKAAGIVTNEGGILCHAAIMSRELRKPCVIGTKIATDVIKTGKTITLNANKGIVILE
jgi:phosphohistidine swiveling domain-containing protein